MVDIQKSTISAMDAKFARLQQVLLDSLKGNGPSSAGSPPAQEDGMSKQPASTTGQGSPLMAGMAGVTKVGHRRHSAEHLDDIQEEEHFHPDYKEPEEEQGDDSEEQEVVDLDSVSIVGAESRVSAVPDQENAPHSKEGGPRC